MSVFFVSPSGLNWNSGTISSPFQTIQHAASVAQPGDTIEIRGGIYHETVTPSRSGTPSAPITYEAYNNESVTIDGANVVNNWSPSSSVYTAPVTWNLGEGNNQVFVDGTPQTEARWPAIGSNPSQPQKATAQWVSGANGTYTIYDSNLTAPANYLVGSQVDFTPGQAWVAYSATITASGPGYISFAFTPSANGAETPSTGMPYYVFGTTIFPGISGEWSLTNGVMTLNPSNGANPNSHDIEVKQREFGLEFSGVSNTIVKGINLFACSIDTETNSSNDTFDHLNAYYISQFVAQKDGWTEPYACGILLNGHYNTIQNSTIAFSSGDGVFVSGTNCQVLNNTIHDVGLNGTDSSGIRNYGFYNAFEHNTIYNCGRDGIEAYGYDSQFTYNSVYNCGLQTTDCGGIYTWQSDGTNSLIGYNRIANIVTGGYGGTGVYLDNNSRNWTVVGNITANVNAGLKLNGDSQYNNIHNNTFDATQYSLAFGGTYNWQGTVLANDIFVKPIEAWYEVKETFTNDLFNWTNADLSSDYTLQPGSPAIASNIGALPYDQTPFASGSSIDWSPTLPNFTPVTTSPPITPVPPLPPPPPPTTPVGPPPPIVATSQISASTFATQQGITSSGTSVEMTGKSWTGYNVDCGSGVRHVKIDLNVPRKDAGKKIYLRLNSPTGKIVGSITPRANKTNSYHMQSAVTKKLTGDDTIFLFGAGIGEIASYDWITFY